MTDISMFPDDTLEEAANFCRNPDLEPGGPWCYTTASNVRWEFLSDTLLYYRQLTGFLGVLGGNSCQIPYFTIGN